MSKKKKQNPISTFGGYTLDLAKFNLKSDKEQYAEIEKKLKDIYKDDLDVSKKHVMKVIRLTYNPKDDYIYLPYSLKVTKKGLELIFRVERKVIGIGWIIFGLWLLLLALIGSTYLGIKYINVASLNKDIDGDGIADINIDINNDRLADINVDTNNDNKPNINVDYKGNRKSVFNIDTDNDGNADSNLINDASTDDKRKECKINCDTNGDGWPDLNLDLDGDGIPDTDIDTNGDGIADLNLDINGDGVCDIMCDTDGDNKCDTNCIETPYNGMGTGTSSSTGNADHNTGTAMLIIRFSDGETVNVDNLVPDDQPFADNIVRPYNAFTVENLSDYPMYYSLRWRVQANTFVTNNLQYMVSSTNGGPNIGYQPAPRNNEYIIERVMIPARATQKYTLSFTLIGLNRPQNEDQNRIFRGTVEIET